jgi:hypothetical protein
MIKCLPSKGKIMSSVPSIIKKKICWFWKFISWVPLGKSPNYCEAYSGHMLNGNATNKNSPSVVLR